MSEVARLNAEIVRVFVDAGYDPANVEVKWVIDGSAFEGRWNSVAVTVEVAPAAPSAQALLHALAALSNAQDRERLSQLGQLLFALIERMQEHDPEARRLADKTAEAYAHTMGDNELLSVAAGERPLHEASSRTVWRYLIIVAIATAAAAGAAPVAVLAAATGEEIIDEIIGDSVKAVIVAAVAIAMDRVVENSRPTTTPDSPASSATHVHERGHGADPPPKRRVGRQATPSDLGADPSSAAGSPSKPLGKPRRPSGPYI